MGIIKSVEIKKNRQKGITLISLVVTIIILLILAGISIGMLSGDNSILGQAGNAKKQTDIAGEKEILQISAVSAMGKSKYGDITKEKLDNELNSNIGITNYTSKLVDDGIEVTFTNSGRAYIVDSDGNVEKKTTSIEIAEAKVVTNSNGTGEDVTANSKTEGTDTLYISFVPTIAGGNITSVTYNGNTITSQNGVYVLEVSKNGDYAFSIIGTIEGESISTSYTKSVDKYKLRAGINVGDYVDYTPTVVASYSKDKLGVSYTGSSMNTSNLTQETLNWRVLKIYNDGKIDLIADPTNYSTNGVYFKGATGYNNGLYILHDICKSLYSNVEHNIEARSVSLEDFENNMTDEGKATRDSYNNSGNSPQYGNTNYEKWGTTYTNKNYPNIYALESGSGINTENGAIKTDGIKDTEKGDLDFATGNSAYKTATGLTARQTYYYLTINSTNYGDASEILKESSSAYWIASRFVRCDSNYVFFGLRHGYNGIDGTYLFNSNPDEHNLSLRPVVQLGANVKITPSNTASSSTGTPHTINW